MSRTITNKTAYDIYAYNGTNGTDQTSSDNTIKFIIKPGQTVTWTDTSKKAFFIGVQYTYPGNYIYKKAGDSGTIQQITLSKEVRLQDEEADTYTLKTISSEYYGPTSTIPLTFYDNPDGTDTSGSGGGSGGDSGGDSGGGGTTTKTKTIEYTLDNHTTAAPESFKEGDTVTITLTADDGYYISAATGTRFNGDTEKDETIDFTIATDKKTATATVTDTTDYYSYEVTGESDAATTPTTLDGIVSIYLPTNEEMGKIGQQRYYIDTSASTRVVIDLGAYIVNYIKLFIDISATGKTNCIMGYFNTGIELNYTTDNILIIDCGQITIEGINKNALDFSDVDCKIFLPFIGFTTIDIDNVMNKTVKLLYKVNILNGDTVALIYADSILIDDENGNMGYTVPYIMNDNILNSLDYSFSGQYMLDKTPYILLSYREKLEDTPLYNGHTWEKISDLTGLTKFNDVVITGIDCTIEELTEIENLLKTGVIL